MKKKPRGKESFQKMIVTTGNSGLVLQAKIA